jgi:hypothetical protein
VARAAIAAKIEAFSDYYRKKCWNRLKYVHGGGGL